MASGPEDGLNCAMLECPSRGEAPKFGCGVFRGKSCAVGAIGGEPYVNFRCGQHARSKVGGVGACDPFNVEPLNQYNKLYPGSSMFTAGSASTGMYRGLKLWEAAVKEAGSLNQEAVIKALDHAKIAAGPGGPAEMVPGQHHARLNMYIAQASNGIFNVVKNLGVIEPNESVVSARHAASR